MTGLLVLALVVAGLAMVAFGIVALRDEAPEWMLRIRRPGRILSLGVVALVAAFVVNYYRFDFEEAVQEYVGRQVSCDKIGALRVEEAQRDVYACVVDGSGDRIGCFTHVDGQIVDLTSRVETPGTFPGRTTDC